MVVVDHIEKLTPSRIEVVSKAQAQEDQPKDDVKRAKKADKE